VGSYFPAEEIQAILNEHHKKWKALESHYKKKCEKVENVSGYFCSKISRYSEPLTGILPGNTEKISWAFSKKVFSKKRKGLH